MLARGHAVEETGVTNLVMRHHLLAVEIVAEVTRHRLAVLRDGGEPRLQVHRGDAFRHRDPVDDTPAVRMKIRTPFPGIEVAARLPIKGHRVAALEQHAQHAADLVPLVDRVGGRHGRPIVHCVPAEILVTVFAVVAPVPEGAAIQIGISRQQSQVAVLLQVVLRLTLVEIVDPVGVGFLPGQLVALASFRRRQVGKGQGLVLRSLLDLADSASSLSTSVLTVAGSPVDGSRFN